MASCALCVSQHRHQDGRLHRPGHVHGHGPQRPLQRVSACRCYVGIVRFTRVRSPVFMLPCCCVLPFWGSGSGFSICMSASLLGLLGSHIAALFFGLQCHHHQVLRRRQHVCPALSASLDFAASLASQLRSLVLRFRPAALLQPAESLLSELEASAHRLLPRFGGCWRTQACAHAANQLRHVLRQRQPRSLHRRERRELLFLRLRARVCCVSVGFVVVLRFIAFLAFANLCSAALWSSVSSGSQLNVRAWIVCGLAVLWHHHGRPLPRNAQLCQV